MLTPRLPKKWAGFTIHYRYRETHYRISIVRGSGPASDGNRLSLDGKSLEGNKFLLVDDRRDHFAELQINRSP